MKKVGIITLKGNFNYGNKLQNYALVKRIQDYSNYEVTTIWKKVKFLYLRRIVKSIIYRKKYKREKNFIKFNKYLNIMRVDYNKELPFFDYIEIGSDQVWNTSFPNFDEKEFLAVPFKKSKKFSYAASFGINDISDDIKEVFKENLNKFKKISVREEQGINIIKGIDKDLKPEVVIDPTMMLTKEEWSKIASKPKVLKTDKYILNYFLGKISKERADEINRIAQENNCEIINILDKNSPFYSCGPEEFLYLEKNAFLICTDSFHSSVFAILFDTPFIVFDRVDHNKSMNSRLDTLLSTFGLENRKFNGKQITKENLNHDYTEAYKILEEERKKSEKFLKKALDIE